MTFGGATGRRLLLLVAFLATIVVLGCWDNQREMQRVLDQGYVTTAEITGAQFQRKMPFALDGWRPRFVEQDLSLDLTWQGRDGKPREHKKVPVTERFAGMIMSGDQVRLVTLPVRVLDDASAVPAVSADSAARLASLLSWLTIWGYIALAAWAGFAAMTLWARAASSPASGIPLRRTLFGLATLGIGGFLAFQAWSEGRTAEAMSARGIETTAEIMGVAGGPTSHTVQLSWKDGQGAIRHYGPTRISEAFWKKITLNGELAVKQTPIRYLQDESLARPTILDDVPEQSWQSRFAKFAGLILMLVGAGCLFSAVRHMRRS